MSKQFLERERLANVEALRNPVESSAEWRLRKNFLMTHYDNFTMDRLVCLSKCYVNVEMFGCRYPKALMKQLFDLSANVPKIESEKMADGEYLSRFKGLTPIKFVRQTNEPAPPPPLITDNPTQCRMSFVRASSEYCSTENPSAAEGGGTGTRTDRTSGDELVTMTITPKKAVLNATYSPMPVYSSKKGLGYGSQPVRKNVEMSELDRRFVEFSKSYEHIKSKNPNRSPIDWFHMVGNVQKTTFDVKFDEMPTQHKALHNFRCKLFIDFVEVAEGFAPNKKAAKANAYEKAAEKIMKPFIKVVRVNPELQELHASDEPFSGAQKTNLGEQLEAAHLENIIQNESNVCSVSKKRKYSAIAGDISQFIILEPKELRDDYNAVQILRQSADFNRAVLEYSYHLEGTGVRCRVLIEGQTLVECFGNSRTQTKAMASEKVLELLRGLCWTIKVKQATDTDAEHLTKDEVMGDIQKQVEAIPDYNIGNQLLKKMGWSGGGVGAEGNKGLAEPVAVNMDTLIRREGLGLHTDKGLKEYQKKIKDVIENYAKSERQDDLVFAPDFTKEERAIIHDHCRRLGLKTRSRGKEEERYLTVSRRRTAFQLFNHLMNVGGETYKYELVPPLS